MAEEHDRQQEVRKNKQQAENLKKRSLEDVPTQEDAVENRRSRSSRTAKKRNSHSDRCVTGANGYFSIVGVN
jgi:hypothetical protein